MVISHSLNKNVFPFFAFLWGEAVSGRDHILGPLTCQECGMLPCRCFHPVCFHRQVSLHMNPRRFGDSLILPRATLESSEVTWVPAQRLDANAEQEHLREDMHHSWCSAFSRINCSHYQKMEYLDISHWRRPEVLATEFCYIEKLRNKSPSLVYSYGHSVELTVINTLWEQIPVSLVYGAQVSQGCSFSMESAWCGECWVLTWRWGCWGSKFWLWPLPARWLDSVWAVASLSVEWGGDP